MNARMTFLMKLHTDLQALKDRTNADRIATLIDLIVTEKESISLVCSQVDTYSRKPVIFYPAIETAETITAKATEVFDDAAITQIYLTRNGKSPASGSHHYLIRR